MKYRTAFIRRGRVVSLEVNEDDFSAAAAEMRQVAVEYDKVLGWTGCERMVVPLGWLGLIKSYTDVYAPSGGYTPIGFGNLSGTLTVITSIGEFELVEGFVKKPTIILL